MGRKDKTVGDWLRQQLDAKGMTAKDLAEITEISVASMYFYCNGKRVPSPEMMQRIAKALNVEPFVEYEQKRVGRPPEQKNRRLFEFLEKF